MFIAIMSTLSERLKQARQYAQLTQEELAEKSGVTQASISKIELGKNKTERAFFRPHFLERRKIQLYD